MPRLPETVEELAAEMGAPVWFARGLIVSLKADIEKACPGCVRFDPRSPCEWWTSLDPDAPGRCQRKEAMEVSRG